LHWNKDRTHLLSPTDKKVDFVYNRLTDFLLEDPKHEDIKSAWLEKKVTLSPQPKEYLLLADKTRLLTFQSPEALKNLGVDEDTIQKISEIVLPISEISSFPDKEELWKNRK